ELTHANTRLIAGLAIPIEPFGALDVGLAVQCSGLRGAGGAAARFFFLNEFGRPLPDHERGDLIFNWSGSSAWRIDSARVRVPPGAVRAVFQVDKLDSVGSLRLDDVRITAAPEAGAGAWIPFHAEDETRDWLPVGASPTIAAGSALDVSFLV